ncbi:MAG: LapD/MoxY N-terminal periplasmic domain-containing protein [Sulfurimonas sp.]|jgi:diguanylate cyclase (GGDEF)-like protein|nr:LapD/MoxY N-terminal periplasmic domain-containing protein [Sulfurimonas sp.]
MSLFKQMALGTSILIVILLSSVMVMNFHTSKEDMLRSLYQSTVNNISSLTNKVALASEDDALLASTIDAEFDSGYFKKIEFVSNDGSFRYIQEYDEMIKGVPQWFVALVGLEAPSVQADVSSGWSMIGHLSVQADTSLVYQSLYTIFLKLLSIFAIFTLVALVILQVIIHIILRPLKEVQKQAEAVTRNEFIIQEKIPRTKEFQDVVLGMNNMVAKVKAMFDKGNEDFKKQKELEYKDKLTGLKNRKYLIDKLPEYLKIDASSKGGINIMVALSGVIEANEKIGHQSVDALFVSIAEIFKAHASNYENSIVSRMNGTEFSILLPECTQKEGMEIAYSILESANKVILENSLNINHTFISLGLYEYNYTQTIAELLSRSDHALTQAKFNDKHIYIEKAKDVPEIMGKEAWRETIKQALASNGFSFTSWKVLNAKTKKTVHNALSLTMKTQNAKVYPYGQFMAPANQAGLSSEIYRNIIHMMFTSPDPRLKGSVCSLRLSYDYLDTIESYHELYSLCKGYANKLPFQLIIEMPDKLVRSNSEQIKLYKNLFESYNIEMGIYEFIGEGDDYHYLQELRPIYIKAEANFFLSESQQALSALKLITDTVGITLIATSVMNLETLHQLEKKDIHVIQGKATELVV